LYAPDNGGPVDREYRDWKTTRRLPVPADESMKARAAQIEAAERQGLVARTPRSGALHERALRSLPLGVPSSFQANDPYPVFLARGRGSRVWDVDGNEYVDYHNGFGTMVVGHAHPKIREAVAEAAAGGMHFAAPTEVTVALAEELCRRFRLERVRFSNSGTEATMDALRLARAVSGRDKLVKVEGSYHGHHDAVMFSVVPSMYEIDPAGDPSSTPFSKGIPASIAEDVLVVPFNDADALERVLTEHQGQVGAMILEPVMMNIGIVPPQPGYLERIRELCSEHGVVLIFDEVKTGATVAPGGAIDRYGVRPDLACFAKAIGGGSAMGAFGGKAEIMDQIGQGIAHQGTFNGNPLAARVGLVTLTEILTDEAYRELDRLGALLAEGCRQAITKYGIPAHVQELGLKGCVSYRPEPLIRYRDYLECDMELFNASWPWLLNRGLFMTPGDEEQWTISVQHTEDDIGHYVEAFTGFCEALAAA
jgi:glutamate-1-semialdehyde 2,1-aminomutase